MLMVVCRFRGLMSTQVNSSLVPALDKLIVR